jgi:hypothetical protein
MGNAGYRHQLERARRFRGRIYDLIHADWGTSPDEIAFQDMMWAFFQNCWHVKDWIKNDPLVPSATKSILVDLAENHSADLKMCQELCNATKHLGARPGAKHSHVDSTSIDGFPVDMDCMIEDASGNQISGKHLAQRCIAEWERILTSQGLAI